MAVGQTFSALLPWYRCLNPTEVDPGTDICFFTTLGQMAQSKKKTPGQTFTALLPWDRWLSPKRRPRDRHLLLYYPGTDGSIQKEDPAGQTFTALLPWDRWLSPKRRPRDRHLLLYYPGTDGSLQNEDPGTDIYCFTTLGTDDSVQPKQILGRQTLHCSGVGTVAALAALAATLFRP